MPENIILLNGKAGQVFRYTALMAEHAGERTLRDIAGPDPLEQGKRAEAWRTIQEQRGENDAEPNK